MTHWEVFLSHAYQAHCLLDMGQKNMFTRGEGSVLDRLSLLYGRAKHVEKAVTIAGQFPKTELSRSGSPTTACAAPTATSSSARSWMSCASLPTAREPWRTR